MSPENKNKPSLLVRTIILILILMIIMYLAMTLIFPDIYSTTDQNPPRPR